MLIGDALGVPYEFKPPKDVPSLEQIDFAPPAGCPASYRGVPPGTWSDDGAQALTLLDSLLRNNGLDLQDFSQSLVRWMDEGRFAVDQHIFDIGIQTGRALGRIRSGVPPVESGRFESGTSSGEGNGSLMRVLPVVLWHRRSDAQLVALATMQSIPTHASSVCQAACAMYCLWARRVLAGMCSELAWEDASDRLRLLSGEAVVEEGAVGELLRAEHATTVRGGGHVVNSLWSARHCLREGKTYERAVKLAVAMGNDTDTTAAITGGLAGLREGLPGIPEKWMAGLRGVEEWRVADLLDVLCELGGNNDS